MRIYFRENKKTVVFEQDESYSEEGANACIEEIKKEHKIDDGRIFFLVKG